MAEPFGHEFPRPSEDQLGAAVKKDHALRPPAGVGAKLLELPEGDLPRARFGRDSRGRGVAAAGFEGGEPGEQLARFHRRLR